MPRDDIQWALKEIALRRDKYKLRRDYYEGHHRLLFATDKFLNAFGDLFHAFADNICPAVVDALVDRLQIRGLQPVEESMSEDFETMWREARLKRHSGHLHLAATREGDSYMVVWPGEDGEPRFWAQDTSDVCVSYSKDQPDVMEKAAKLWRVSGYSSTTSKAVWRMNLYYRDKIEKWYVERSGADFPSAARGWALYDGDEDGGEIENPHDLVPVFHFANNAPIGRMGRSELEDVIPIQDALNKSVADMLVAMEFSAYPQRHATGIQVQKEIDPETGNPTGRPSGKPPFEAGADRVWATANKDAAFGQFEASDLTQFIAVSDSLRSEAARITGTPLHYFMPDGTAPSGEALKTSEARLVKKAEDRSDGHGQTWTDLLSFAMMLRKNAAEPIPVEILWDTFESRDRKYEAEIAEIKVRLGVSNRQVMRELGYTDEQIEQFADEREADGSTFGASLLEAFEVGAPVTGARATAAATADE